jgi:hypothetical protein
LESKDGWNTAKVTKRIDISTIPGDLTAVVKKGKTLFGLRSRLDKFGSDEVVETFELVKAK